MTNATSMFEGCTSLTSVDLDDYTDVTDAASMFKGCTSLTTVTSTQNLAITNATSMFEGCTSLTTGDLQHFVVTTTASSMYKSCTALITISNYMVSLQYASSMFERCSLLTNMPDFSHAQLRSFERAFYDCYKLGVIDWSKLGNISRINYMNEAFYNCGVNVSGCLVVNNITDLPYSSYYKYTNIFYMATSYYATFNCVSKSDALSLAKTFSDTTDVKIQQNRAYIYEPSSGYTAPSSLSVTNDVISIDEADIPDMLLYDRTNNDPLGLTSTTVSTPIKFNIGNVTSTAFGDQISEATVTVGHYINDSTTDPTYTADTTYDMASMYYDLSETTLPNTVTSLTFDGDSYIEQSPIIQNTAVTDMTEAFKGCTNLLEVPTLPNNVTNLTSAFAGCTSITDATIVDGSKVTDASSAFGGCTSLENADISSLSILTDASNMFDSCTSLETVTGLSSTVTDLTEAFSDCTSLTTIHDWSVDTSTATMTDCFSNCSSLVHVYVKKPTVSLTDWKLVKVASTTTGADVTVYNTALVKDANDEDALDTVRTKSITYRGTEKLNTLMFTEEFLGLKEAYTIPDETLINLLKYRYPFANTGLNPSEKNFVLWAAEGSKINTNIDFGEVTQNILNVLRVFVEADGASSSVLVANAQSTTDSQTNVPARTVKVNGDLIVTDDTSISGDLTVTGDINGTATNAIAQTGYATCTTAADVAEKTVTIDGFELVKWASFTMYLQTANTVASATLNVNGTGAKSITINGTTAVSTSNLTAGYWHCVYDGTYWRLDSALDGYKSRYSAWSDGSTAADNSREGAYCNTAAGTAAKTATMRGYVLRSGNRFPIYIQNSNSSATALTLNIASTGAKPLYINGSASSTSNYTLNRGTYMCSYNGTYYNIDTDGGITASGTIRGTLIQTDNFLNALIVGVLRNKTADNTNFTLTGLSGGTAYILINSHVHAMGIYMFGLFNNTCCSYKIGGADGVTISYVSMTSVKITVSGGGRISVYRMDLLAI